MAIDVERIEEALKAKHFEIARRLCNAALAQGGVDRNKTLKLLSHAHFCQGDFRAALEAATRIESQTQQERLEVLLMLAEGYYRLQFDWREAPEVRAGMTHDEYGEKMNAIASDYFAKAVATASTPQQRNEVTRTMIRCGRGDQAQELVDELPTDAVKLPPKDDCRPKAAGAGTIEGRLRFPDGAPAADAQVTLGLHVETETPDVAGFLGEGMGYHPHISSSQTVLHTRTDATGAFRFDQTPAGEHEFLAVTLDPQRFDIPTRFVAHAVNVKAGVVNEMDLTITDWQSAPPRPVANPFAPSMERNGARYKLVHQEVLKNPFYFHFHRQPIRAKLPSGAAANPQGLLLLGSDRQDTPMPFQLSGTELTFFAELEPMTDRVFALYQALDGQAEPFEAMDDLAPIPETDGKTAVIDTGKVRFRIPWSDGDDPVAPLLAVRGADAIWRGSGRLRLPQGLTVVSRTTRIVEVGPLALTVRLAYKLSNGAEYSIAFTAHRGERYLLAHEVSPELAGAAFEFSMREFKGGRGYLHWTPEGGTVHWRTFKNEHRVLAHLQESVPWWIPPNGFGYAMTPDGLDQQDYVGVFTVRRGEWIDNKFEQVSKGPGDDNRELDWPFPEAIGSTISMISAHTDAHGDVFFRFGFFDGQRKWGMLVSTLDRNDGPEKEISRVQHKLSSPRLQDFKDWRLDEQDRIERPSVVARRGDLRAIRRKKDSPTFARVWQRIATPDRSVRRQIPGPVAGVRFIVDGEPLAAWRKKLELVAVAQMRSREVLLGRDYSDAYSPVGGRSITQWAEDYDLIAPSGVFTPDEERLVRQYLMLMGHMFMECDLMNWRYGSRNVNFEADRADIVGAVGLAFRGNPDADYFIEHAAGRLASQLPAYCTPSSGKWYENPACYYLHAAKCYMNLAFHLANHGLYDPTEMPRLKDFLRWAVLLLTPQCPASYEVMRDGADERTYLSSARVRRVAPVGDHAHVGPWVPDFYAMMAKLYRGKDPQFADLLMWAYQSGGADGGYYGNFPLLFCAMNEEDMVHASQPLLTSRRLEGFGAIFRGNFGRDDEFFLLFKQGPGGYRYQRTEGSIIMFANGKPLIYDGGEAGETWRHSTLSFYETHMPLACGHVERFYSFEGMDFVQGVHPEALRPGQPIQFNDSCRPELIEVAKLRYANPNPADVRSVLWVKDEYVVMHDDLNLSPDAPTNWHLQVVSNSHVGDAAEGFLFKGRFGTDIQVLLPDQSFDAQKVQQQPVLEYHRTPQQSFAMRHLMLSKKGPSHFLAVLRPIYASKEPLTAQLIELGGRAAGVKVSAEGIDDHLFLSRKPVKLSADGVNFEGRYGAIIRRKNRTELVLMAGGKLENGRFRLTSDGPAVYLTADETCVKLVAEGVGTISVEGLNQPVSLKLTGGRTTLRLQ